jgi:hypothetical protein
MQFHGLLCFQGMLLADGAHPEGTMSTDDANRDRSPDLDPERGGDRSGPDIAGRSFDRDMGVRESARREQREQDQQGRQAAGQTGGANRDFGTERRLGVADRRQDRQPPTRRNPS